MTSPFSTFEEFSAAKGPIYTFANNSAVINFFLLVALGISVYFFYASFNLKQEESGSQTAKTLGALLLAGGMSLFSTLSQPQTNSTKSTRAEARSEQPAWTPFAVLGLMGMGSSSLKRRTLRKAKRSPWGGTTKQSIRTGTKRRSFHAAAPSGSQRAAASRSIR